jgi:RES domain-containing protein
MPQVSAHKNFSHFYNVLNAGANPGLYTAWQSDVVRQSAPRWMSRPYRLTGAGSVLTGARWSVKGLMPTIYASTTPDTLNAEAYYKGRRYGWTAADFNAQLMVGMHWELQAVVDLRVAATLRALKVTHKEIISVDWDAEQTAGREPVTQAIARAAFEHLAEGLIVPSARLKNGVNIVYFPSHRRDGTVIQTLNAAALPPDMHGLDP